VAVFADGKIEGYLGPAGLGAADDLEAVIVEFIGRARTKLSIAVQELDSEAIARAILAASWRGVHVELFLEQDYLRTSLKREKGTGIPIPPLPEPGETSEQALERVQWGPDTTDLKDNRRILSALLRSDVQTRGDFNPKIFHQKFILRDYFAGKATKPGNPALLTGSANFTWTDTHVNLNHLFVFRNSFVCRQYEVEFNQLRGGSFGRQRHGEVPNTYNLGGVPVKVLFAPDHTPELEFMKQMLKGAEAGANEIVFAIFTFSGSSGIDDTMVALSRGGMTIRGVLDPGQANQKWAAPKTMKPPIELFVPKKTGVFKNLRKLHHKLMVIDERVVVAGSFNYTQPANEFNDENLFVIGSVFPKVEKITVNGDRCKALASHMKREIERIIAGSKQYVP
jgi:phosphatidylserine/phosphatidylglycerophosphate/cardiolipin synthase-like enzyme